MTRQIQRGRGARLKVLQKMPRIHSWWEVIAPRDCWYILYRTTLRPAAGSATSTSSSLEPPSSPTQFPSPLTPPEGTSNEQFHYCLTLVINLHGHPLALLLPAPILHLLHPLPCRGSLPCFISSLPKTPPSLAQFSSLAFSGSISLYYVSSLLSFVLSLYLFLPAFLFYCVAI